MIDLHRLRLLREVQARGTITAAAAALSFTPSAVSQQLAKLERETGTALLERVGRGVQLTDAGRLLAEGADRILASLDALEAELEARSGAVHGRLRVGAFQSAALALLAPALLTLDREHPALEVEVVEADPEQTLPALLLGDLDLIFADDYGSAPPVNPAIDRENVLDDRLRLVLARNDPLAAATAEVRLSDLRDYRWAVGQPGTVYSAAVERACRDLGGFAPRVCHRAGDLLLLLTLVRSPRTVALLPDILAAERDKRVAVRPIAEGTVLRTIYTAVRRSSARRPTVIALRQAIGAVARSPVRLPRHEFPIAGLGE